VYSKALEYIKVDSVLDELSYLWCSQDPFVYTSRAIARLVPGSVAYYFTWNDGCEKPFEILGESETTKGVEVDWVKSGLVVALRPFDPSTTCPFANQVYDVKFIETMDSECYHLYRELGMNQLGFGSEVEAILYRADEYIACLGCARAIGDRRIADYEISRLAQTLPNLIEALNARRAVRTSSLRPGNVTLIADAIDAPAFIATTSGIVVHANRKAVAAYPEYPNWMKACCSEKPGSKRPRWVKRVPIRLGEMSFWLLLPEKLVTDPKRAPLTPWARRWNLQPGHARVAALLMQGLSDKQIADRLGLEFSTVRACVKELFVLARVHSRQELASAALKNS